jgi:uncharacterized membrane protein YhaH (DUF805 family)
MATSNPYATPETNVATGAEEYGEVKIFTTAGRIGRIRYIGYSIGMTMLVSMLGGLLAVASPTIGVLIIYPAIFVISIMLAIQRCHDFNTTGWLSIISLIPLVNLIFWFIPGTDGANDYGKKPPPNTTGVIILASLIPVVAIVGILAAIAIPQYAKYVDRAKTSQMK